MIAVEMSKLVWGNRFPAGQKLSDIDCFAVTKTMVHCGSNR